jgi:hypothetical protein
LTTRLAGPTFTFASDAGIMFGSYGG